MNNGLIFRIENLFFQYPDSTRALNDVSLSILAGERVGVIGPNGAGKSTLILHLNGILTGSGVVTVLGLKVEKKHLKEIRRNVGLVFQNPDDQLFCPSVFEDVAFGPRNLNLPEDEVQERVEESLDAVGLAGFGDRSSSHLSVGEKKRAAIATVYSMYPEVYVFDEPTSSLDPRGRRSIIALLNKLKKTQVIISHDLAMIGELCNRIIVMDNGRIVADDKAETVLSDTPMLESCGLL